MEHAIKNVHFVIVVQTYLLKTKDSMKNMTGDTCKMSFLEWFALKKVHANKTYTGIPSSQKSLFVVI